MTLQARPGLPDLASAARYLRALTAGDEAITRSTVEGRVSRLPAIRPRSSAMAVVTDGSSASSSWRQLANCLGLPPEMFYPERFDRVTVDAAVEVCSSCVVRDRCLLEALTLEDGHGGFGVWGGKTEKERRVLRRSLPRWARCGGCSGRYVKRASGQRYCEGCRGSGSVAS